MTDQAALAGKENDAFTRLILLEDLTFPSLLLALAISFTWGAMHALTPGHGKTIVGAYLVGSRGTPRHAVWLGMATTITHTAGVFALGLVTLLAARYILPEKLFPWLSLISGLLVAVIGLNLFRSRLRSAARFQSAGLHAGGQHVQHDHRDHHHEPDRHIGEHHHSHGNAHDHDHVHAQDHEHDPHHVHSRSHRHAGHSHLPPGADGAPVTWRNLLALGISGGLLPCPSALVVLLSAIALDRVGLGLVLVLFFSLGLAGVLTAIGLVFVYAGRLFEKAPLRSPLVRLLPALSALFITLAGLGISGRALIEIGLI